MWQTLSSCFRELNDRVGAGWNRFWYAPADPLPLCALRVVAGLFALAWCGSYSQDLLRWFGPDGLLPIETVQGVLADETGRVRFYDASYWNLVTVPGQMWLVHGLGLAVLLCFTIGWRTRVSSVLALVVVLAYVHRAPMISGLMTPLLAPLIAYLCVGPAGACLSVDRWLCLRRSAARTGVERDPSRPSHAARVALRLVQVHLCGFCLLMGLTRLGGATWWRGDAIWWLAAQSDSRLVDVTFVRDWPLLINAATHAVVLIELLLVVLVWNRIARPLVLAVAAGVWLLLALLTGQVGFFALWLAAHLAFAEPQTVRRLLALAGHHVPAVEPG